MTKPTRLEIWSVWTVRFLTLQWGLYCVDFNRLEFNEDFLNAQFDAAWWSVVDRLRSDIRGHGPLFTSEPVIR